MKRSEPDDDDDASTSNDVCIRKCPTSMSWHTLETSLKPIRHSDGRISYTSRGRRRCVWRRRSGILRRTGHDRRRSARGRVRQTQSGAVAGCRVFTKCGWSPTSSSRGRPVNARSRSAVARPPASADSGGCPRSGEKSAARPPDYRSSGQGAVVPGGYRCPPTAHAR